MPRALLSRRILAAVVFALVFGATCVLLGRWQLSRFEDKDARAAAVEANYRRDPVPLATVLPGRDATLAEGQVWTRVLATGRYAADRRLLVRNRALQGAQGLEVLVPFQLDGGGLLLVDRGWVPNPRTADAEPTVPEPATGPLTVVGWLKPGEPPLGRDLPAGQLASVDLEAAAAQLGRPVYAAYLVLGEERTPSGLPAPPRPAPLAEPSVDRGPHFAYALQWFLTALLGVAFVVFLYRGRPGAQQEREEREARRTGRTTRPPAPAKVRIWDEEDG